MAHRIGYTIRQIADADLPTVTDLDGTTRPATLQELQNMDLVALGGGYYACAEHEKGVLVPDPTSRSGVKRDYQPHGPPKPGTIVAHGTPAQRLAMLPDAAKPHVLHAHVFRAKQADANARELCAEHAAPNPVTDASLLAAGQSLAATTDAPIHQTTVRMSELVPDADVVIAENLLLHHWHGERPAPAPTP